MAVGQEEIPSLTSLANAAFAQAARKVIERAQRYGTPIIVWKDGRVVEIPVDDFTLPAEPMRTSEDKER